MLRIASLVLLTGLLSATARADWSLDNTHSRLSFVTTKAGAIAEVHHFGTLSGTVDGAGNVEITIDLATVDTMIPVRDDRMRQMLFQVAQFPTATIAAKIDMVTLSGLDTGSSTMVDTDAQVSLHGQTQTVPIQLVVAKLSSSRLLVTTVQPVVVVASQFALADGVEALREVAGLPSISPAVPVSAVLSFESKM